MTSTFKFGDPVIYENAGVLVSARVLQSQIVPFPDKTADGGIGYEEHLILEYLDPKYDKPLLTSMEMDAAHKRVFGVRERSESIRNGFIRATLTADGPFGDEWNNKYEKKQLPVEAVKTPAEITADGIGYKNQEPVVPLENPIQPGASQPVPAPPVTSVSGQEVEPTPFNSPVQEVPGEPADPIAQPEPETVSVGEEHHQE